MQPNRPDHLDLARALRSTEITAMQSRVLEQGLAAGEGVEDTEPLGLSRWMGKSLLSVARTACAILRRHRHSAYANLLQNRLASLGQRNECR